MKKALTVSMALLLLLGLAACGPEGQPVDEPGGQVGHVFVLNNGDNYTAVDEMGNVVIPSRECASMRIIADILSGEQHFIEVSRVYATGEVDEFGWAESVREYAVYDMTGQLIHDFSGWQISDVVGDLASVGGRVVDENGELAWVDRLYSLSSGELLREGIGAYLQAAGDHALLMTGTEQDGIYMEAGVLLDASGAVIKELGDYDYFSYYYNDDNYNDISYIVGGRLPEGPDGPEHDKDFLFELLDVNGELLFPQQFKTVRNIDDGYLVAQELDESYSVYDLANKERLMNSEYGIRQAVNGIAVVENWVTPEPPEMPIETEFGELMLDEAEPGLNGEESETEPAAEKAEPTTEQVVIEGDGFATMLPTDEPTMDDELSADMAFEPYLDGYCLMNFAGEKLTGGYDNIWYDHGYFVCNDWSRRNEAGLNLTVLYDGSGQEIMAVDTEESYVSVINAELFSVTTYEVDANTNESSVVVYNADGTEAGIQGYDYIWPMSNYTATAEDGEYLIATKEYNNAQLIDILDLQGQPVLTNLKNFSDHYGGKFLVSRGFEVGLMDVGGNWLYSESRFNGLTDDQREDYWYY